MFSYASDDVQFGEVVSAPPQLLARPRGSVLKAKPNTKTLKPKPKASRSQDTETTLKSNMLKTANSHPTEVRSVVGLKRKQDIEDERERLIEEYRLSKKAKLVRTNAKNRPLIL